MKELVLGCVIGFLLLWAFWFVMFRAAAVVFGGGS